MEMVGLDGDDLGIQSNIEAEPNDLEDDLDD